MPILSDPDWGDYSTEDEYKISRAFDISMNQIRKEKQRKKIFKGAAVAGAVALFTGIAIYGSIVENKSEIYQKKNINTITQNHEIFNIHKATQQENYVMLPEEKSEINTPQYLLK